MVDLSPLDDRSVECIVRMWGEQVSVLMHPSDWKLVSLYGGTPMRINCRGVTFPCRVRNVGEHYLGGKVEGLTPKDFDARPCDDHWGTAWIDWQAAIPDLVREGLEGAPELLAAWQRLSLGEMRGRLSDVYRARSPGARLERQVGLLRLLAA